MRRAMKVLADKYRAKQEAEGHVWIGNRRQFYQWFVRVLRRYAEERELRRL
jgi:hypothetical protein